MWERVQFIVQNLKIIVLAGFVFWAMIIATLDLIGVIDIQTDCPSCSKVIEIIPKAFGHSGDPISPTAPVTVRVTVLP